MPSTPSNIFEELIEELPEVLPPKQSYRRQPRRSRSWGSTKWALGIGPLAKVLVCIFGRSTDEEKPKANKVMV